MTENIYLILGNGSVFKGKSFGAEGETFGEVVFTTGMVGYLETLTDSSYFGQIIVQTFPLIGNYGVISNDLESKSINASAYIVNSWCQEPSNFRSEGQLDTFLKSKNTIGICGIDTRHLTEALRKNGTMNAKIVKELPANPNLCEINDYKITNAVKNVSVKNVEHYSSAEDNYKVAVLDFGINETIKKKLLSMDCELYIFPYDSNADEILAINPDGILLPSGPGDPEEIEQSIETVKKLAEKNIPIFGIGLGHQVLSLANGFKIEKLKFGHRGANQPVKSAQDGRIYITNQNHGYVVASESIDSRKAKQSFTNVNDKSCEGIEYENSFSVQFAPDTFNSTMSTAFLYDKFLNNMEVYKNAAR